ncbi:MAG TPA: hypothetical protein VIF15_15480 [Polyangiaceae bacterium]|jgi:hypothetical protein
MRPPKRVHLPSGRAVELELRGAAGPRARAPGSPLFSELSGLVADGDLVLRDQGRPLDLGGLELRDFHALRAIATRLGWLAEEPIEIACRNCGEATTHSPCATLELGPFVDGELDDPDLDRTLDLTSSHAVPPVPLGGGVSAREAKLRDVTVAEAAPLHRALRRRRLVVSDRVVRAMGVESLGPERHPRRIAAALARCSDEAWSAIGELFLEAHYPPRLSSVVLCPKCGARNDLDAPYEREFEPAARGAQSNDEVFPDFDAFDARAIAIFDRAAPGGAAVALIVEEGVPACDDGGEPLLGAYVPPGGEPGAPVGRAEITVYYRTFRAMWDEDGPYDWEAELEETLEHELEHHTGWRVGHDPMDDEERDEIARERSRLVGRKTAARASVGALAGDLRDFLVRTWPIWLIVAAATLAITVCGR